MSRRAMSRRAMSRGEAAVSGRYPEKGVRIHDATYMQ
jgi:hypothetical protein